jgi:hypothetical protein
MLLWKIRPKICPNQLFRYKKWFIMFWVVKRISSNFVILKKLLKGNNYPLCEVWDRCNLFFRYFRRKKLAKILAFFAQTTASFCDRNIVFWEKRHFSQKSQKNCDLTSIPGHPVQKWFFSSRGDCATKKVAHIWNWGSRFCSKKLFLLKTSDIKGFFYGNCPHFL